MDSTTNTPPSQIVNNRLIPVGKLISTVFSFIGKNWSQIFWLFLIPNLLASLGKYLQIFDGYVYIIIALILVILGWVFSIASKGAIFSAVHGLITGSQQFVSTKDSFKLGFKMFWPLLLVIILPAFSALGAGIFFIIPGIFLSICLIFATVGVVIDGKKTIESMIYSYRLVSNRWWQVFGRVMVMVLIIVFINIVLVGVSYLFGKFITNTITMFSIQTIVDLVAVIVSSAIEMVFVYILYTDIKRIHQPMVVNDQRLKKVLITLMIIGPVLFAILAISVIGSGYLDKVSAQSRMIKNNNVPSTIDSKLNKSILNNTNIKN